MPRNKKSGIFQTTDPESRVADFSYDNESIAELIVQAWTDPAFQSRLTQGAEGARSTAAKQVLAERGIYLTSPIVITEKEYDGGFVWPHEEGVVFVLPNDARTTRAPANRPLLETAKLLMACVPNGI